MKIVLRELRTSQRFIHFYLLKQELQLIKHVQRKLNTKHTRYKSTVDDKWCAILLSMYTYAVVAENHMDLAYGHYVQRIGFEVFIYKTRCEKVEKIIQYGISWSQFVAEIALI